MSHDDDDRLCENCGRWVEPNETLYRLRVELFADGGDGEVRLDPPADNLAGEWEALVRRMENMSPDQVREATDQVHETYSCLLCPECRAELHGRLKRRRNLLPGP
jgi:predicted RNA-binding Zn-ribbon protein involved in translation (DUF1610 family)